MAPQQSALAVDAVPRQGQGPICRQSEPYSGGSQLINRLAIISFALQFTGLTVYSWAQYHHFDLGIDFATLNQAATEISHGNLNPYSTTVASSYLDNHFGLVVWPIAALFAIFRSPFVLLVVQNVSLVATGIVAFIWARALIASREVPRWFAQGLLAIAGVLLILDPLVYYTAALDVHLEATATLFAVLAAYDLWAGRYRRAWIWVGCCLVCGDLGALYVVGIGISATLAGRATRMRGALSIVVGLAWVSIITALHANQGSFLDQYAYLAGRSRLPAGFRGVMVALGGAITHPARPYDMLESKARMIWRYLPPGGVIGLVTPWGIGVPVIVLLSSALQANTLFIGEPFQQFAVVPFVLIGSVALLSSLMARTSPFLAWSFPWSRHRLGRQLVATVLSAAVLLGGVRYAHEYLRSSFTHNATMGILPASEASALGTVLAMTPPAAEVIASADIVGRFAARRYVYVYQSVTSSIPLRARSIEVVMETAHYPYISATERVAAARYLRSRFQARTLVHESGVWALTWSEPARSSSITIP